VKRRVFVVGAAGLAIAGALSLVRRRGAAAPEPELDGRSIYLLDSAFVTDAGQTLRLRELRGHYQVLALIFTRCPKACPTLVKQLQALERRLPEQARAATRFALLTIDPEHDTPEALRAYRQRMGLGTSFTLLRGDDSAVRELAASLGFGYGEGDGAGLLHSKLVTLLDPGGLIAHQQAGLDNDPERLLDALARRTR
jgi:protein SCO1/2